MADPYILGGTALVVTVPAAEQILAGVRSRYDPAVAAGVPAHVTVLYPWLPQVQLDEETLAELATLCASLPGFDAALTAVDRFPGGVGWLAPEPAARFKALTTAVWTRWPQAPPYQGEFDDPIPHLTIAQSQPVAVLDAVAEQLRPLLPIPFRVGALHLLAFDGIRWRERARFELG